MIYPQIAPRVAGRKFGVVDLYVRIYDFALRYDAFVYESHPFGIAASFHYAFAVERESGRAVVSAVCHIFAHYGVGRVCVELAFQFFDFFDILVRYYIVGVQPHHVFFFGFGEREITCGGEIVVPFEIENFISKTFGDAARAVVRTRIRDNDFVRELFRACQTAGEYGLFVFYNKTQ